MRNDLLFAFLPYLSVVLLLVVPVLRLASPAVRRGRLPGLPGALELSGLPAALRDVRHLYWGSPAWRLGFCLIFLAHLL
ncbi:MAG TPA: hypothetical protein VMI31_16130, partial [Fimbriimonadaceae bacterium]|nr:hypothetical protein [Fimbriimonadaceae bacterium]